MNGVDVFVLCSLNDKSQFGIDGPNYILTKLLRSKRKALITNYSYLLEVNNVTMYKSIYRVIKRKVQ